MKRQNSIIQKSKSSDDEVSSKTESMFKTNSQSNIKETKKEKITTNEKLVRVYYIYLKLLMGRLIKDDEELFMLTYYNQSSEKKVKHIQRNFEYVNEFDYSMGDIVINFPNPDSLDCQHYDHIDAQEALNLCEECFCSSSSGSNFEMLDNLIFTKAIEKAILLLKSKKEQEEAVIDDDYQPEDEEVVLKEKEKDKEKQNINSLKSEGSVQGWTKLRRFGGNNDQLDRAFNKMMDIVQQLTKEGKQQKQQSQQALKQAFNRDYAKLEKHQQFIMTKGRFLKLDEVTGNWERTKNDTQDFLTLIRNIVLVQLTKQGFLYRTFVARSGRNIFCVLYQQDDNLKKVAQQHEIQKQLNFQFSDLLSLEPVDKNFRPLRLNNRLWKPHDYKPDEISHNFKYLSPKIIELLNEIDYLKIARETNLSQMSSSLFSEGEKDIMMDEDGPSDEEWQAYYEYLMFLRDRVLDLRESFLLDNQQCLMINGQKKPYEIYMRQMIEFEKRNPQIKLNSKYLRKSIKNEDIQTLIKLTKVEQIKKQINLDGRSEELWEVFTNIFQIQRTQQLMMKKYEQVKSFLNVPAHKSVTSKLIKVCKREILAYSYYQLFQEALKVTNYNKKNLNTMWDLMETEPFESFIPYQITEKRLAFSQRNKLNALWKKYCITETGKTSIFSVMERLKMNSLCLGEKISFNMLFSEEYVLSTFCLNDSYELHGTSTQHYFDPIFKDKYDHRLLSKLVQYPYFQRQAKHEEHQNRFAPHQYEISEYQFVKPKLCDLADIWRFTPKKPWYVPTEAIREYYGEKIALYFTFLGYYTFLLMPIGICGILVNIIYALFDPSDSIFVVFSIVFGFLQTQWSNLMCDLWQSKEQLFAIQFGQLGHGGGSAQQRSDFKGEYLRSIENDNLNNQEYPEIYKIFKVMTTISLQLLLLMIYTGIVVGIFYLTQYLQDKFLGKPEYEFISGAHFEVTIPAFINLVVILLLDEFYENAAVTLTDYENHQTTDEYEMNFVFKKYFLSFISLSGPILVILFIYQRVGLHCPKYDLTGPVPQEDCFRFAQYYFACIFILQFSLNIWEIVKPKIEHFIKQFQQKREERVIQNIILAHSPSPGMSPSPGNEAPHYAQSPEQHQPIQNDEINVDHVDPVDEKTPEIRNPFQKINDFIVEQSEMASYAETPDRYGTVDDYMEITLQYSMLCLFGISFPFCFPIAFIWNVLELQTDKLKLLHDMQRPLPLGEKSIGVWNAVLEGLSYLGILVNCGIMTFQRARIIQPDALVGVLAFFLIILLINFFLKFIENSVFGELPYEIKSLMKRHQYLIKSTFERFRGSNKDNAGDGKEEKDFKRYPVYKMFGSEVENVQENPEDFVEVSSDSDVEDYIQRRLLQETPKVSEEQLLLHQVKMEKQAEKGKEKTTKGGQRDRSTTQAQKPQKKKKTEDKAEIEIAQGKKKETIEDLIKWNQKRISNWCLKFRFQQQDFKKAQGFVKKNLTFMKRLNQLSNHSRVWTDDRFTLRYLFLRRYKALIRNLDLRRKLIFEKNQLELKMEIELQQKKKYEKVLKQLELKPEQEDLNQVEREEIEDKINKHVEKHLWLEGRKVVVFKINGVWFNQYRKNQKKVSSIKTIENFQNYIIKYEKIISDDIKEQALNLARDDVPQSQRRFQESKINQEKKTIKISVEEQFQKLTSGLTETKLKGFKQKTFLQLLDKINYERRQNFLFRLSTQDIGMVDKQLDYYYTPEFRKQINLLSPSFIPYRLQCQYQLSISNIIWDQYVEDNLRKNLQNLILLQCLDSKKSSMGAQLQFNIFASKPQTFRWLIQYNQAELRIDECYILYHTEINHHRKLVRNVITRGLRFYDKLQLEQYLDVPLRIPIARMYGFHLQKANSVYGIKDPLVKGYLTRFYQPANGSYFCNGKTLKDQLSSRSQYYTDQELSEFLGAALKTLEFAEKEFGMFHGCINLQNLYLTKIGGVLTYSMLDFGMFYWYDAEKCKTYFARAIESNDEMWYLSPELLQNYLNQQNQKPICPQKCDLYSLGMVCLMMATLGKMSVQIEKALKTYDGDVERAVKRWIVQNKEELQVKYNNTLPLILQIIQPDQKMRGLPSTVSSKFNLKPEFKEYDFKIDFDDQLRYILERYKYPKLTQEKIVRIFDGKKTDLNNNTQEKILLGEYLKSTLCRLEILLVMQQYKQLQQEFSYFEQNLLQQFFYILPYAKQTPDVGLCIENYSFNQVYDIIEKNQSEFKYIVIYMYIKCQFLILTQEYKTAFNFCQKAMEILKSVIIHCSHLIKEINKQDNQPKETNLLQIAILNQQQLGELIFQKEKLIDHAKQDPLLFKQIKAQEQKNRMQLTWFVQLNVIINQFQMQFHQASDLIDELIIDYTELLKYDKENSKKKDENKITIINEKTCIKLVSKLQAFYFRLQILLDNNRDVEFLSSINESLLEMRVAYMYLSGEAFTVDDQYKGFMKQYMLNTKFQLTEDFRKSMEQCIQHLYMQTRYLQLQQMARIKDYKNIKIKLKSFQIYLVPEECVFDLQDIIPILGWIGELYFDLREEQEMIKIIKQVEEYMLEFYFVEQNLRIQGAFYFSFPSLILCNLVYYCSQIAMYNPAYLTEGIFEGLLYLIKDLKILKSGENLSNIIQIKILHVINHNKRLYLPYFLRGIQIYNKEDIDPDVLVQSQICQLQQIYQIIQPFLLDETNKGDLLKHQALAPLLTDLLQGLLYVKSLYHFESEPEKVEVYYFTLDARLQTVLQLYNRNEFYMVEHCLVKAKMAFLHDMNSKIADLMGQVKGCILQIREQHVIQQETQYFMQVLYLCQLDLIFNYCHLGEIKFSKMVEITEFKWIRKQKDFDFKLFLIKLIDYNLRMQQVDFATEIINFSIVLFDKNSELFMQTQKNTFNLTLKIFKVKAQSMTEQLREYIDKYDKKEQQQIEDTFAEVQDAYKQVKKNADILEIGKFILSQSLEQAEMRQISLALNKIDMNALDLENQVLLCQLGVKLVIYQILTAQFKEADEAAFNVDQKIFDLMYNKIINAAIKWQSDKIFLKSNVTDMQYTQLVKLIKIESNIYERYEYNLLIDFNPVQELFLNVADYKLLKTIKQFRILYAYIQCIQALAQMMKGDFKQAQQNIQFVLAFEKDSIDEIKLLWANILMIFYQTSAEYELSRNYAIKLLNQVEEKEKFLNLFLHMNNQAKTFKHIELEHVIDLPEIPEEQTDKFKLEKAKEKFKQLQQNLEQKIIKETLKPFFDIQKLRTEAYLTFLEASINVPDHLTTVIEPIFKTQSYVQQYYGQVHMFNGHILRLIALMYAEFLSSARVKDLEDELMKNAQQKISTFKKEEKKRTLQYLELNVKGQCTPQFEAKYREKLAFIQSQITVLKDIKEGINIDIVCRWCLQTAHESYNVYEIFKEEYGQISNPYMAYINMIFADVYLVQNKAVSTMRELKSANKTFEICYTTISNPDYCRLYFKQGTLRQNMQNMLKLYIDALMNIQTMKTIYKYEVLIAVIKEQEQFLQHFDSYRSHQFVKFLEFNLDNQINIELVSGGKLPDVFRKDQKDLQQMLQVESEKLVYQRSLDPKAKIQPHTIEGIMKETIACLTKDKVKQDYTGEELFHKAFQICKLLFTPQNVLYQKIESQMQRGKILKKAQQQKKE